MRMIGGDPFLILLFFFSLVVSVQSVVGDAVYDQWRSVIVSYMPWPLLFRRRHGHCYFVDAEAMLLLYWRRGRQCYVDAEAVGSCIGAKADDVARPTIS